MIRKINLKCASYKEVASLETDKKINLIYGLNGSGKSTFSEYLRRLDDNDERFSRCSIETDNAENKSKLSQNEKILVYNQKWVNESFYENPTLKGIFSLSKENTNAKKKIDSANQEKEKLEKLKNTKEADKEKSKKSFDNKKSKVIDSVWKVKTDYTGGERKTDKFFKGLKSDKTEFFNHILKISKPASAPLKSIDDIKKELDIITNKNVTKILPLNLVKFNGLSDDDISFLKKEIVGSRNSTFSSLLEHLQNSDWVNAGFKYVENQNESALCPFCQQKIDKSHLLSELKSCFDKSYEQDKHKLQSIRDNYKNQIENISTESIFKQNDLLKEYSLNYETTLESLKNKLNKNLDVIKEKISTPSKPVVLNSVESELLSLNTVIQSANTKIDDFNTKIDQKNKTLKILENLFWQNIRLQYDVSISNYEIEKTEFEKEQKTFDSEIEEIKEKIEEQNNIIAEQSKLVSNIDEAVSNINNRLVDLGIDSFQIVKHDNDKAEYKLVRLEESVDDVFESLSEGEKMIISFLYFIEECKGKEDSKTMDKKKIVVIDDPISSLSHIYVFNVAELVKAEFTKDNFDKWEQVFILTHSLYFFYELVGQKKFSRKELSEAQLAKFPNLYRLIKSPSGTKIVTMQANEIQNDYQMYWSVVNNKDNQPALIANCMRNIIDYFFGFIEKNALVEVFQRKEFKDTKYQAFYRYINRESHSDNINIYDMKEFDYSNFQEAFHEVFSLAGYEEHYNTMKKIGIEG